MRSATLAKSLLEDRRARAERTSVEKYPTCLVCGRTYARPGRFCSDTCIRAFDDGAWPYRPPIDVFSVAPLDWKIVAGPPGAAIGSAYYAKPERKGPARIPNSELVRPRRQCAKCGQNLPVWVNGKKARKNQKFCQTCSR
jgi:predicted nucleic acid-binding Zn ribbon protein